MSYFITFYSMNSDMYLELLSLLLKNLPSTLMARVLRMFEDFIAIIVLIASYKIAFPGFLLWGVVEAT